MQDFVHLHVHSQFSILDGQASIQRLVDKAIADGMRGIAITDHGNMFGVKEFWNYIKKKNGARRDKVKQTSAAIAELQAAGLNTEYEWTTEPMTVVVGRQEIIPALETALMDCREGDSVEIYLTYDVAYGKHYVGLVPSRSSVVWYIDIVSVIK